MNSRSFEEEQKALFSLSCTWGVPVSGVLLRRGQPREEEGAGREEDRKPWRSGGRMKAKDWRHTIRAVTLVAVDTIQGAIWATVY